jgi:hypothetical protein
MSSLPPKADLAELHGALIFINAEAALLGRLKTACRPTRVAPHNAFSSSGTSPNFLISLCDEFNLRLER